MLETDLDQVMCIESSVHSHPWSRANFANSIAVGNDCWVAQAAPQLVGYVIASSGGGEAELLNISVAATAQRRGIGTVLLDFIVKRVKKASAGIMFLEVRPSNDSAIALYYTYGFNEAGIRPNYYPTNNGREDALILAKTLDL